MLLYARLFRSATYRGQGWLRGPATGGQMALGVSVELLIFLIKWVKGMSRDYSAACVMSSAPD